MLKPYGKADDLVHGWIAEDVEFGFGMRLLDKREDREGQDAVPDPPVRMMRIDTIHPEIYIYVTRIPRQQYSSAPRNLSMQLDALDSHRVSAVI